MTEWVKVISKIATGKYKKVGGGSYKTVYQESTNTVYAREKVKSENAQKLFDRLETLSTAAQKHVLIPSEFIVMDGYRYWKMDFCEGDLDKPNTFTVEELSTNFEGLEKAVNELHTKGITAMDIKPANMLFNCHVGSDKVDKSIQMTDLDGSLIDGEGKEHLTLYYVFPQFQENGQFNYKNQDLFALYTTFLHIINEDLWQYKPFMLSKSMTDWTGDVFNRMDKTEKYHGLVLKYLNKLNDLAESATVYQLPQSVRFKY
jgi:serine/threonine protein kinase